MGYGDSRLHCNPRVRHRLLAVPEIMFELIAVVFRTLKLSFSIFHRERPQATISANFAPAGPQRPSGNRSKIACTAFHL